MIVRLSGARKRQWSLWRLGTMLSVVMVIIGVAGRPEAAFAHGGTDESGFTNYESVIVSVSPSVPGLDVWTFGVTGGIKVENNTNREVVVLGYNNEPYLRLNTTGTFANLNSPATYVNLKADANVPVPDEATSSSVPNWYQLSLGDTVWWHDHRAHWMGTVPPDVVQADPASPHVVYEAWTIPLLVGNETVTITGQLRWLPPPNRTNWLLISLGCFFLALVVMHVLRPVRPIATLAIIVGLVGNIMVAASRATVEQASSSQRVACFITAAAVALLFVIGLASKVRSAPPLLWGLAGAVLAGTAVAYLKVFSFAVMDGGAPTPRMRWAVALELAMGAAVAIESLVGIVERRMLKRANRLATAQRTALHDAQQAALDQPKT